MDIRNDFYLQSSQNDTTYSDLASTIGEYMIDVFGSIEAAYAMIPFIGSDFCLCMEGDNFKE